jgi:AAA15 family ATPase/GTPase
MLTNLEIQQFRGLEHVKFENLGRANLILGGNNTGKTSILEALTLLLGSKEQLQILPRIFRDTPKGNTEMNSNFWRYVVKDDIANLNISADQISLYGFSKNKEWYLSTKPNEISPNNHIRVNTSGTVSIMRVGGVFALSAISTGHQDPTVVSDLYSQIAPLNPDNESRLEYLLKQSIEPRLQRLRYGKSAGSKQSLVYVDLGENKMLPFTQLGQAFARTLQVYCEIFATRPKILLIDEIENGLYYEGMEEYWKGLMTVLKDQDVQLFATTHSRECMEAAHRAAKDIKDDTLRYLRLDRQLSDPSKIEATTFGIEEMETAIKFNREMR